MTCTTVIWSYTYQIKRYAKKSRFWCKIKQSSKANFVQEATFFILCHRFFLHSLLFKSCCHTTFEYLSHCCGWASLLERATTAAASQQLTELKFKLGREALSTQQHVRKIDDKQILNICFRTYLASGLSICPQLRDFTFFIISVDDCRKLWRHSNLKCDIIRWAIKYRQWNDWCIKNTKLPPLKVRIFWEGHTYLAHRPLIIWRYILKSVHFKKTVARSSFLSKL